MNETTPVYLLPHKQKLFDGERRPHICKKAGIEMIPAFSYAMDRNEAVDTMVDSNLQCVKLLPSEKTFAYSFDNALGIENTHS